MRTPDQKGTIAEAAVIAAAVKLDIGVLKPVNDGLRYDLVFDVGARFYRVQCKWGNRIDEVVAVRCCSNRRTATGMLTRTYSRDEVDLVAAYCLELDRCYVLPPSIWHEQRLVYLRLSPSRNNQRARIHWARDYELERLNWAALGAVAQLGERLAGSQKAAGSSPAGSIF
jgi:hypothetical protein